MGETEGNIAPVQDFTFISHLTFNISLQRFCQLNKEYMEEYLKAFQEQVSFDIKSFNSQSFFSKKRM